MARNFAPLAMGAVALFLAVYFDIKVLVFLGSAVDVLQWEFGRIAQSQAQMLMIIVGAVAVVTAAGAIGRFWMRWLIIGVSRRVEFDLRNDLFAHLQRLSPTFYLRYPTGDIMARATNDLEAVRLVIGPALMYLATTLVMLPLSLVQMLKISAPLTLVTWLPLLLIAPLFFFFSSRIHSRFMKVQETFSEISARVQESLTGIRVIKAYAREDQEADRFAELSNRYVGDNIRLVAVQALFIPLMALMVGLSLLAFLWTGGAIMVRGAATGGGISYGQFISFFVLLMANIWPMAAVGWVFSLLERGAVSMKRLDELFEAEPDVVDPVQTGASQAKLRGLIEVRDLTFAYPNAAAPALEHLTVTVETGKTLGLTGPVGCGKTTLAMLLARRFNPPRGTLLIDGIDVLDWPLKEYRSQVAIVDQEPFVFSETIGANVAYGLGDETNGIIERVCDIAQISGDLENFPGGLGTVLGERGINLSGGQRQRTALARALATEPALLILDDALSAVDTHTEEEILKGLEQYMAGRTTVLVSHRIRTVSMADHILYLEKGRVVEEGTHEELMAQGGKYWDLAHRQQLAEEIEATA